MQASASTRVEELLASRKKLAADAEKQREEIAKLEAEVEELHAKIRAIDEGSGSSGAKVSGQVAGGAPLLQLL